MSLYPIFEWLVVGGFLLASSMVLMRTLAPSLAGRIAQRLRSRGFPEWLAGNVAPEASCDDGCHTCSKCGPAPSDQPQVIVIHKRDRR